MATCQKIRAKRRKVCIADLDRLITIQNRSIQPPDGGETNYTLLFADTVIAGSSLDDGEVWAMIETVSGESVFDGHNVEQTVTDRIYIRWIEGITEESWVLFEGNRYDVVTVENLDRRNEFLLLRCNFKGASTKSNNAL